MTKDGHPSLTNDFRLFVGGRSSYLEGQQEGKDTGKRVAGLGVEL